MNLGWLLLVLGLGPLSKRNEGLGLTEISCCLFERIEAVGPHEPRPAIHMEKLLGRTCKLGGAESMGISKAGETVLARWMEYHIWHQLAGSVTLWEEGPEKGQ